MNAASAGLCDGRVLGSRFVDGAAALRWGSGLAEMCGGFGAVTCVGSIGARGAVVAGAAAAIGSDVATDLGGDVTSVVGVCAPAAGSVCSDTCGAGVESAFALADRAGTPV